MVASYTGAECLDCGTIEIDSLSTQQKSCVMCKSTNVARIETYPCPYYGAEPYYSCLDSEHRENRNDHVHRVSQEPPAEVNNYPTTESNS